MTLRPPCAALLLAALALLAQVPGQPASAACYERIGCSDRDQFTESDLLLNAVCDVLWEMRNGIYKENGYCFTTDRAIARFGNVGCRYPLAEQVPLNPTERANVATIRRVETIKTCPR